MKNIFYDEAEKLVRKVGSRDPFDALDFLNVKVLYSDNHTADGLKGFCTVALKQRYVVLNSHLNEIEQKTVCSHELGHLVIHTDGNRLFTFREFDVCRGQTKQENEASSFGADFAISDDDVLELIESSERNWYQIADELYVPFPFLSYKIASMSARGYNFVLPEPTDSGFLKKSLRKRIY